MAYKSGEKEIKSLDYFTITLLLSSIVALAFLFTTPFSPQTPASVWDLPKHEDTHDFYVCLTNHKTISENFDFKHAKQYYELTEELKRRCYE